MDCVARREKKFAGDCLEESLEAVSLRTRIPAIFSSLDFIRRIKRYLAHSQAPDRKISRKFNKTLSDSLDKFCISWKESGTIALFLTWFLKNYQDCA